MELSIGERDQPHVLVISGNVVAIYKPGYRQTDAESRVGGVRVYEYEI